MVPHQLVSSSTHHPHGTHSEDTKTSSADVMCCTRIVEWNTHFRALHKLALTLAYGPFAPRVPQQLLDALPDMTVELYICIYCLAPGGR